MVRPRAHLAHLARDRPHWSDEAFGAQALAQMDVRTLGSLNRPPLCLPGSGEHPMLSYSLAQRAPVPQESLMCGPCRSQQLHRPPVCWLTPRWPQAFLGIAWIAAQGLQHGVRHRSAQAHAQQQQAPPPPRRQGQGQLEQRGGRPPDQARSDHARSCLTDAMRQQHIMPGSARCSSHSP